MSEETTKSEDEKVVPKNEAFKHAICYAPFGAIAMFFIETKKSPNLLKHIRYGFALFVAYAIINILSMWFLGWIVFLVYVGIALFLGLKAYNWEEVQIRYIDDLETKIKEKL